MKLEIGIYCFNKTNRKLGIGKIINFQSNNNVNIKYKNDIELVSVGNIVASHNIIDLIEVGDYVNGYKVTLIASDKRCLYAEDDEGYLIETIETNNIKAIVTKEQFESMSYKVGA